jgi:predicted unusual protein kinase regulating ubiquinone biosynthesis (AarF/ABC1/UbiB family)
MKTSKSIPTSKLSRASKLLSTGAKVGANYAKYYGSKLIGDEDKAKEKLDQANAEDIYDSLKDLKGSALKMAQMLSMEKNLLPKAYTDKFSLSQFSVPPLSPPLVVKTFKQYFKKSPTEVFDTFKTQSVNAASIGQVHKATKDGKKLAVKIQYPGVADSINTDLAMVKPIAMKMFNIKGDGAGKFFDEIKNKLTEETDYVLELKHSQQIAADCKVIPKLIFPKYYPEYSSDRILTMDWLDGVHLSEFTKMNTDQAAGNEIGQLLWDFYMYQIHVLKKVHADPHPGNFIISKDLDLMAIDFGCMKSIPDSFYKPYFELAKQLNVNHSEQFNESLYALEMLREDDSPEDIIFFKGLYTELLGLFTKPFQASVFDFSDKSFFDEIATLGEKFSKNKELRKKNANRGSEHFIYMNRTFFGLYNLLQDLKANHIIVDNYLKYVD